MGEDAEKRADDSEGSKRRSKAKERVHNRRQNSVEMDATLQDVVVAQIQAGEDTEKRTDESKGS